ncbi:MAG: hypothetical protein Terrestrivirus3_89 [Terrestrivirus sp.]|uniref:Uncharacterized protein n=1 Tax=Terrestrivirus sp. TaxID=2487775 RepID=A0A3G4ZLT3_9VIRU|nr:MAG: hypothetical protein Terrestrivirus3_89 [Terrestrivirus sp.]
MDFNKKIKKYKWKIVNEGGYCPLDGVYLDDFKNIKITDNYEGYCTAKYLYFIRKKENAKEVLVPLWIERFTKEGTAFVKKLETNFLGDNMTFISACTLNEPSDDFFRSICSHIRAYYPEGITRSERLGVKPNDLRYLDNNGVTINKFIEHLFDIIQFNVTP